MTENKFETHPTKEHSVLKLLLQSSKAITSEVHLENLVQRVTDVGTKLTNAAFGAFFYNVENQSGEKYLLYTISGAPKEAFSKFPHPRNTRIFNPTFTGQGIVRYEDVTKESNYGKNDPYYGMPKGHLPVRSYLAAPVISSITNEVIGGLFFGHPEAGIFTQESETLIEGIAAQTAIAMENARLFEEKKRTEQKLRDRSKQYKSIFESTFDAILILTLDGLVVEANPATNRLFGFSNEELIGRDGEKVFLNHKQFETIKEFVRLGRKYTSPGLIKTSSGQVVDVEISASSFAFGEDPHILAVFSTVPDKVSEEAFKRIQEFSEVITNVSPVSLWMTNASGDIIFVNQTWLDWTGRSLEDNLGDKWLSNVITEDLQATKDKFSAALAEQRLLEMEFRIRRKDGRIIWCLTNGAPYYSLNGEFQGLAGSCMDITDRKEAQVKLSSQNVLINTITNNTLHALFMLDDRQFCTYLNPAAEAMTGYSIDELQEKPLHYYIHHTYPDGRHFPIEECAIDRALPAKKQTQGEDTFIHRDGRFFSVSFIASPIIENAIPKGTVLEVRDTTEEKRLKRELELRESAAKDLLEQKVKERTAELEKINYELMQFTSVASHDLKEPLRKISVFSKLLKSQAINRLDSTHEKYLNNIIQSSGRMTSLIEDLLQFSRMSRANIELEEVDLNETLNQILSDLEISIAEKKAHISFQNLPVVQGVPMQLGQVFQNLLSNSLKFCSPERAPVIKITGDQIHKNGMPYYRIVYSDNGIGFNNAYAGKIFDIFQRLHSRDQYEGTGVGLAIVKKIITVHHGEIRAHGIEHVGSSFEILLPVNGQLAV